MTRASMIAMKMVIVILRMVKKKWKTTELMMKLIKMRLLLSKVLTPILIKKIEGRKKILKNKKEKKANLRRERKAQRAKKVKKNQKNLNKKVNNEIIYPNYS